MGSFFKPPSIPSPPDPIMPTTAPAYDETNSGAAVANARKKIRNAAALAQGRGSTILTGAQGLTSTPATAKKVVLGS